uniref:Uncharacterized protein LOC104242657 n=1 Tax=Nicotiana sylvestris TaxID=4096 RepID=A0A1U7YB57_NICSY|nr:PREDICTED: uncharacterized protein LOC104242657 [Nicotiana sylvestris]
MEYYYMDEKWKLSKDDPCCHSYSSSKSSLFRSYSQKSPSSNPPLPRSLSQKNPYRSSLSRSSSQKSSSSSKSRLTKSASQKCANFTRKCSNLAKEQKSKFYIVKRCIGMLVRWNKHGDS